MRPRKCRRVRCSATSCYFKPRGIPLAHLEEVELKLEELEALRLADLKGLYHEEAAAMMGVSRPTFGRMLEAARRKVADSIISGKAIKIEDSKKER